MENSSDLALTALMIAGLEGDAGAYRSLLSDLRQRLESYFSRRLRRDAAEVEDLVQDTLLAVHSRRQTFDRAQSLLPWAYAIARYKLIDHYRRAGRRLSIPLEDAQSELRIEDGSAAVEARHDLEKALALLPPRARLLLRSLKIDELSVAETAVRTGMSQGAVKVAAHRGMKALAIRLGGRSHGDD